MVFFHLILLSLFFPFNIYPIEISLEENKAESGTIGYVDIKKIFDTFASSSKKRFDEEVAKRQAEVDAVKKELLKLKARREKLLWEYEIAKTYEEFLKNLPLSSTDQAIVSQDSVNLSSSVLISSTSTEINIETTPVVLSTVSYLTPTQTYSTKQEEQPFVVLPGVGKIPISSFNFSVSSSPYLIDEEIKKIDREISDTEKKIIKMKDKFDEELSLEVQKENIAIFKKIYSAIEEVAKREGISVVIDKRNILFGMKGMDLTEKVINKLQEQ